MFVWASYNGRYGIGKLHTEGIENCGITITLDHTDADPMEIDIDMNPPANGRIPAEASEEAIAANKIRLAREDSLRHSYTATFTTRDNAEERLGLAGMPEDAYKQLPDAKGNWRSIRNFIAKANENDRLHDGLEMLKTLSRKDLRDTKCEVLWDALTTAAKPNILSQKDEIYFNYVLCPRINGEFLQPFHTEIHEALSPYMNTREINDEDDARALVNEIITWARDSIAIADSLNTRRLQATPAGTLRIRMADGSFISVADVI